MRLKYAAVVLWALTAIPMDCYCWGFYGHKRINSIAVFLLPPEMLGFYKQNIGFLREHSVAPDKRRYIVQEEGPRHYLDLDYYGADYRNRLPRNWDSAVAKFTVDTIVKHGTLPWWVSIIMHRLTDAFVEKDPAKILKLSAEIGHYIADAHVPLHASANHNGQLTGQHGIHAFWESRIPELFADRHWNFFLGRASYIENPTEFIWNRLYESARAADTVLQFERDLNNQFRSSMKFAFEERNGKTIRQYSSRYARAYDRKLKGMVERRMQESMMAVASFWYTAWVNGGQPLLNANLQHEIERSSKEDKLLDSLWRNGTLSGKECD
jgi:hypothetical protein